MDAKAELDDINDILEGEEKINGMYFPLKANLFKAFELTLLEKVKVVLIGQDPYHDLIANHPRAIGVSFGVSRQANIPPSLRNIYKELQRSVPGFTHGDLTYWAQQCVLLLNMCLTVRPHQPESHGDIWLGFINKVINVICQQNPKCVFMLLGRKAQKIEKMLGERALVLKTSHPSSFSANKGFIGSNIFV